MSLDPTLNPYALSQARIWADLHGHPAPDDRMLAAYGEVLLGDMRTAIADSLRRLAKHHQAVAGGTPADHPDQLGWHAAKSRAFEEALQLVESTMRPTGSEVAS